MGFKNERRAIDALSLAIATGAPKIVKERLASRPTLARHYRPLHEAAFHGRLELARLLLDNGADPDALAPPIAPWFGTRPIHRAVEQNPELPRAQEHLAIVRLLAERGADLTARGGDLDLSPLVLAAFSGAGNCARVLVQLGVSIDAYSAAALGERDALKQLAPRLSAIDEPDRNGLTALHHVAASRFHRDDPFARRTLRNTAAWLLEAGASTGDTPQPHAPGGEVVIRSALEWAVDHGENLEVVRLLLERGADPNRGDLLLLALMRSDTQAASLILHYGADPDRLTARGASTLVLLAHWGRDRMVEWLLAHGADPNVGSLRGDTALIAAIRRGLPARCIQALLDTGADRDFRDRRGHTALDYAFAAERRDYVTLLRFS